MLSILMGILNKIPSWILLVVISILLLTSGGLYWLHTIDAKTLEERQVKIVLLETEVKTQKETVKLKEESIATLQQNIKDNSRIFEDSQKRTNQIISTLSTFSKPIILTPQTQKELGVINKTDSDKVIDWMNKEIFHEKM